jgi:hypothetical protein
MSSILRSLMIDDERKNRNKDRAFDSIGQSFQQAGAYFKKEKLKDLGKRFVDRGDFSAEGLRAFAQEKDLTLPMMDVFIKLVRNYQDTQAPAPKEDTWSNTTEMTPGGEMRIQANDRTGETRPMTRGGNTSSVGPARASDPVFSKLPSAPEETPEQRIIRLSDEKTATTKATSAAKTQASSEYMDMIQEYGENRGWSKEQILKKQGAFPGWERGDGFGNLFGGDDAGESDNSQRQQAIQQLETDGKSVTEKNIKWMMDQL